MVLFDRVEQGEVSNDERPADAYFPPYGMESDLLASLS